MLVPVKWRAVINPWTPDDKLAGVLILRGAILWSYSHIEQKLTDTAIRCSQTPEYADLREKPPFSSGERIKYLRKVLDTQGPLTPFRALGIAILDRYDASRTIRNRMAHADLRVSRQWATVFDDIVIDGGDITHHQTNYWPGELEAVAVKAARFSKAVQRLHYRLFQDALISDEAPTPE